MEPVEEKFLITRAIEGDARASETVLLSCQMRLVRYIESIFPLTLRPFVNPEDIFQDVYLAAFEGISRLKTDRIEGVFSWMAGIAKHILIDKTRQWKLRRPQDLENDAGEDVVRVLERLAVYQRTSSKSAAEHEFRLRMERSLEELPEHYKCVVRLRHIEGLSVAETSQQLNIDADTVRIHCLRGLRALRQRLLSFE
ncbi:MAG TPA: RNA polymerase sigma factor [Tepidisphaeraceae bacterium]|jgi:RNA polymerase sigma-70 factor (ECF subfamily)